MDTPPASDAAESSRDAQPPSGRGALQRGLLAVAALAIVARSLHLLTILGTPLAEHHRTFQDSDMQAFDGWARQIAAGDLLGVTPYHPLTGWQLATAPAERWAEWYGRSPVFFKAPLYPYLVAALYWLFGSDLWPVALLQILASTISTVLVYRITLATFDSSAAFLAAVFYAVYAPAIHYDVVLLRGPWIVLVGLTSAWQLIRFRDQASPEKAAALGVTSGVALLLNEGSLGLPLGIVALFAAWLGISRRLARTLGAFLAGLLASFAPVFVRNLVVSAPVLQISVNTSIAMGVCNAADANPHFFDVPRPGLGPLMEASGGTLLGAARACLGSFHGDYPALVLFYLRKSLGLFIPYENPDNANFYYAALKSPLLALLPNYAVLLPLAIMGFVLAAPRWRLLLPLLPAAGSLLLSILLTLPLSRYRVTLAAFLFPLAGLAAARLARWTLERRFVAVAAALVALALSWPASRLVQERVVFQGRPPGHYLYRPVEFLLGSGIEAKAGRPDRAADELLQLAFWNPDRPVRRNALLGAAFYLGRAGRSAALRAVLGQISIEFRDDPLALMSAGDGYRDLLQDRDAARSLYRLAAAQQPDGPLADEIRKREQALP